MFGSRGEGNQSFMIYRAFESHTLMLHAILFYTQIKTRPLITYQGLACVFTQCDQGI